MKFFAPDAEIGCALTRLRRFTSAISELPLPLQVNYASAPGQLLAWRGLIYVGNPHALRVWAARGFVVSIDYPFDLSPREWVGGCCGIRVRGAVRYPPEDLHQIEDPVAYLEAINTYDREHGL